MKNFTEMRKCKCENYMVDGFVNEDLSEYYCSKNCLDGSVSKNDQNESFENESLYHTNWIDDTNVFSIFDNQYIFLEDAKFIQKEFGNPSDEIKVLDYDFSRPVFTIENNQQIELEI